MCSEPDLDDLLKSLDAAEGTLINQSSDVDRSIVPSSAYTYPFSSCTHPCKSLIQKPFDELWKDIPSPEPNANALASLQQQAALGEITLEDFLVKAGVISMSNQNVYSNAQPLASAESMASVTQPTEWLQYHVAALEKQQPLSMFGSDVTTSSPIFGNAMENAGYMEQKLENRNAVYTENQVACMSTGYVENQLALAMPTAWAMSTSSESPATPEKKRKFSEEVLEKCEARRQRRMIKNRESAARSRQRKQDYTNKLEQEVTRLRRINERLMKNMMLLNQPVKPKYQLRRTSSATF